MDRIRLIASDMDATLLDGHSASIPQLTLARFIEGGHFGAYVRAMRGVYADRLDVLAGLVRAHLAGFVEPRVPAGGMQMPCVFTRDISERAVIDRAAAELREACSGRDHNRIRDLVEALNEASRPFAQRIMDASIKVALESRSAYEIAGS